MIEIKFKHTDIGLVPEDWEVSTFGIEFKKLNAASYTWSETFKDGSCAYLHYGEIHTKYHDHLDVQHSDLPFISKNQAERFNKLQNGDLIMLNASEDYDGVNDCVEIINCDKELIAGQHTIPLRPISDKLVKGFIGYIPSIPAVRMQLIENAVGTKVYGVTNDMLQTVLLPIPTRHEQHRIASALMKVDALISNLDKLIAKKYAIKKGAMQELLTGKKRLPGFEEKWKETKLGDIGSTYSGLSGKSKQDFKKGNKKYITFLNVLNNPILKPSMFEAVYVAPNEHQNKALKGDLFFNTSSETPEEVGYCSMLGVDYTDLYLNSFCFGYRLSDNKVSPLYLCYYFRSKYGRDIMTVAAQGVTRYNISKSGFSEILINMPPTRKEQAAIVNVLSTMDSDICLLEKKREKYRHIKQGMMRDLLTGRIRLVENVNKENKLYTIGMPKAPFEEAIVAEPHPD